MAKKHLVPASQQQLDANEWLKRINSLPDEQAPEEERGYTRALADTAVQFGKGAVSGVRMMSDVFGADNVVSGGLRTVDEALNSLLSATAKQDQQEVAAILQEAEGKGWLEQIGIGLKAAGVAPGALLAQAAGTAVPTMAAALIPGALPARIAAGAMGVAQGVGTTKGSIYETVKSELLKSGASPEEAEARATDAQSYGGSNSGQIALGGAAGGVAGSMGIEKVIAGLRGGVAKEAPGLMGRMGMGAALEAGPEALQGGQEKYATNTALANEGYQTDPMSGVVASGTMEGVAGAGMGAAFGIPNPTVNQPPATPPVQPPQKPPAAPPVASVAPVVQPPAAQIVPPVTPPPGPMQRAVQTVAPVAAPVGPDPVEVAKQEYEAQMAALALQAKQAEIDRINQLAAEAAAQDKNPDDAFWAGEEPLTPVNANETTSATGQPDGSSLGLDQQPQAAVAPAPAIEPTKGIGGPNPADPGAQAVNDQNQPPATQAQAAPTQETAPAREPDTAATGVPATGATAPVVEGAGVKEPTFSLDTFGWNPSKLSDAYSAEQLNQLWQEVQPQYENRMVDNAPVDERGMATKQRLNPAGQKIEKALKSAMEVVYQRKKNNTPTATPGAPSGVTQQPAQPVSTGQGAGNIQPTQDVKKPDPRPMPDQTDPLFTQKNMLRQMQNALDGETAPSGAPWLKEPQVRATFEKNVADLQAEIESKQPEPKAPETVATGKFTTPDPIVEHTTAKGKVLRGVVRTDLTKEQAFAIDKYSFKKGNGYFIREEHISKLPQGPTNGTQADQTQQAAQERQEAPEAALPEVGQDEYGPRWNRMTTVEREAVAINSGLQKIPAGNVAKRGWQGLDPIVQDRMKKGMAKAPEAVKQLSLEDQLKQVDDKLASQGMVQDANTRGVRDQLRKAIAERDYPQVLKAVDDNVDVAEAINQADKFRGDEPISKTIERVLKNRGITEEYRKRWTDRLMKAYGQNDELDSEMQSYENKPNPTYDGKPVTPQIPNDPGVTYGLPTFVSNGTQKTGKTEQTPAVSSNTVFTEDAAAAARARLKAKLGRLGSGLDPEMMMDGITLAGYHIEKGARTFAAYAKAMIEDLGEGVKPYLKSWYMGAKYDPRTAGFEGLDSAASVDAVDVDLLATESEKASSIASAKPSLGAPEGRHAVAQSVADYFIGGGKFDTILQARKFISELTGEKIESSSKNAKLADETIEMGVVLAGREMVKAGRKQNRSDQTIYDRLVSLYNAQPNLSVRSSTSVEQQAYSTPIPLAFVASRLAKIKNGDIVSEPTAGNSALALEVHPNNAIINELNDDRIGNLKAMGFTPTQKNAATEQLAEPKSVDAAVMNPPFGAVKDSEGKTIYFDVPAGPNTPALNTREIDHAIVFNSLATIKDDGRAVLIVGGVDASNEDQIRDGYRGKGKREFYYKLYNEYKVTDHFTVDGGLYSRQGAGYPVDVIVIDGRGKSARDLPAANLPQRIMSYDQLKEKLNEANTLVPAGSGAGVRVGSDPTGVSHGTDVATSSVGSPDGPGIEGAKPGQSIQTGSKGDGVRPLLGQSAGSGSVSGGGKLGTTGASSQPDGTVRGGSVAPASISGESGRKAGDGGNRPDDVGANSGIDGKLVGSGLTDRRGQEAETENQVGYTPKSDKASVGTLVPVNMRDAIQESLSKVADDVGDLDDYVSKALGYTSKELGDYLSAEQIDALALAIYNAEKGKGFIIGDQTGIGKGRVNAAMIRYAIKKGQVPIFITEKPNLYADMIRDLDDIGMANDLDLEGGKPHILMTNNGESIPYELYRNVNGEVIEHKLTLKAPKSNAKDAAALLAELAGNGELGRYKVIFSTYSQLQSIAGKATERQRFLTAFAKDNFIIFDESHNAGGTGEAQDSRAITKVMKAAGVTVPGRAGFARNLVKLAKGTFFSSATYAKRPDVMDLYSSTNMSLAVDKPADLAPAIKAGGVPLQQAVATMLTADGQYIRRERTFAGVSYETQLMSIDRQTGENMAESMRWILAFSRAKEALLAQMQKEFDKDGAIAQNMGSEKTQVAGANFGSVMHNLIDQMLLALKVEESVKLAIAKLKAGEKVVLTVSNTMGSFLKDYADEMGIRPGDAVSLSFKDLYLRYLDKQRKYKVRSPGGVVEEKYLSDADLGHLLPMHNKIQAFIQNAGFGSAPISPIDYMHNELRKAGYKTDEITGRTATVDYEGGIAKLASRTANIKQRLKAIGDFNSGAADVLILNQSGSTGLSLHASAKFKDQKKRHMIIVQAEKNIDTHMQMLGRVHRTGQVVTPGYTQAMADTPAEMRPAAVLSKKMAGLSANTTASRKSAVAAEGVVDFINEYGGQVAAEFLQDNPEVHDALGGQKRIEVPSDLNEAGEDLIRKLTGYIPILPLKQQEQIYADLIERYNDLIARENSMGTNRLETKALDLDAKTLTSEKITANKGSATETSVFAEPANMEQVDVKRNVKPLTPQELEAAINETLSGLTPQQYNTSIAKEFDSDLAKYVSDVLEKMAVTTDNHALVQGQKRDQLFLMGQNIKRVLSIYKVGDSVTITDKNASVVHGVITGITHNQKTKNPAAGSAWKMTFALANGDARTMSVGFGQLGQQFSVNVTPGTVPQVTADGKIDRVMIRSLFENGNNIRREKRWMVTGNLLAGFSKYQGQIVSYTKSDGGTGQGVLMNRQFDYKKEKSASTLSFSTSAQAIEFLTRAGRNAVLGSPDRVLRIVSLGGERYSVMVPSSKREGGSLYLDRGLLDAFGTDFYKQGQNMSMRIDGNDILERGLNYLIADRDDISLAALTNQDVARKVLGMDDAPKAVFSQGLFGPSIGPKPTLDQVKRLVAKFQNVSKNVIPITVVQNPSEIVGVKVDVPAGVKPSGALIDGQIYLFSDNLKSTGDVSITIFHELFHLGLSKVIPAEDYAVLLKEFAKGITAQRYINEWKQSPEGIQRKETMPSAAYEALAKEEGLAIISEELFANLGVGTKNLTPLVSKMVSWMTKVAEFFGLPGSVTEWIHGLTRTDAEKFVGQMVRAAMGGDKNLAKTRGKFGTKIEDLSNQTRLRSLDSTLNNAANSVKAVNHVTAKLNEALNYPGTLSKWHTTVGSMYNLAERSAPFKRVFDAAQAFIQNVSFYATEAADLAPKILPRMETWKDMLKTPISFEDNKAISAPILQGTLVWMRDGMTGEAVKVEDLKGIYAARNAARKTSNAAKREQFNELEWTFDRKKAELVKRGLVDQKTLKMWEGQREGYVTAVIENKFDKDVVGIEEMEVEPDKARPGIVFTEAELKQIFNLTPSQIKLYKEFRSATDKSLDNMAKADMLRYGGKDVEPLRDVVMDAETVDDAAVMLRDYLYGLRDFDAERADALNNLANGMIERAGKVTKLKEEGYAPLSRFGQYSVDVVVDGERQYFSLFESKSAANQMAEKLKAEYGAENVAQGTMSQKQFELFQGVTPESIELFGNMLGLDSTGESESDKAFQEYLRLTKNNRSAMKRMIHRKGVAGFSEDIGRVLAAFVYSNARQTAAALHMGEIGEAVQAIPKGQGELKDAAVELADYIKRPREEAQALRGLLFAQYLGGSIASAFVNFTQPLTVSFPYLSMYSKNAGAALVKAMKDQKEGTKLEDGLKAALHKAEEDGVVSPQAVHELMAQAQGRATLTSGDGTTAGNAKAFVQNNVSKLALGWGKLFGWAEQINRRSTFIAAYRIAVENKVADPGAFATKAVNETQFINNKANRSRFSRGAIGATLMTFKSYSVNYLELLHRMATQNGVEGKKAAALMLGMLFLMAGASGLPGADDLDDLVDFFAQRMGYNFSSKKAKQEFLEGLFGKPMAQFIDRGITGLPGSPIDFSGRMSMGNLAPGSGFLLKKNDHSRDFMELLGPVGDMVKRGFEGADKLLSGDVAGAAKSVAPKAAYNALKGLDMAQSGAYNDDKGYKVISSTPFEAAMKAIGFQPASVAKVQQSNYLTQRSKDFYAISKAAINAKWARGIYEGDKDRIESAKDEIRQWNIDNPDQPMTANMPAIIKKVREMRKDKAQRIADTAPKAMRAALKRELATQ